MKKWSLIIFIFIFILSINLESQNSAKDIYNSGFEKLRRGDFIGAIQQFDKVILINPRHYYAYFNRANAKFSTGEYQGALYDYNKTIEINPDIEDAYFNRAIIKSMLEDYKGSINDYDKSIQLNPKFADAYNNRGFTKMKSGNIEESIIDFDKAIKLNPKYGFAYFNRANAKYNIGDLSGAMSDYDSTIKIKAHNELTYYNRGCLKNELGKYEEAIQDFNLAIQNKLVNDNIYSNRGLSKYNIGDFQGAINDYSMVLKYSPKNTTALNNIKIISNKISKMNDSVYKIRMLNISQKDNLGISVNSEFDDICPLISPDDKTLYFVRQGHPSNIGYNTNKNDQDIWFSNKLNDKTWTEAKNIGTPLNNKYNNGITSVTPDGNTVILLNRYFPDSNSEQGISISHRSASGWSFPEYLKIKNYHNLNKFGSCYLANDGKTLFSSMQTNDSRGGLDIYVSFFIDNNNEWSEPINLGNVINSNKNEYTPFLASDGITLYFSSEGWVGSGGADIFISRRLDNTWKNWSIPENLGRPINSPGWDAYFTLPASGDYAYFVSSNNSYGRSDIFRVLLPKELRPKPVVLISGNVVNAKNKNPIEAKIIYEILPEGKIIGIARANPITGEYKIALPSGKNYGFRAEANGFISINDNIETIHLVEYKEIERNLELVPIEKGQIIRLNNVFFDFDKSILREESFPELDRLVEFMNNNPKIKIEVGGHTDYKGSNEYNHKLSEDRARAVKAYLVLKNINIDRIKHVGYGRTKPVSTNATEEGMQQNRRVEFTILK